MLVVDNSCGDRRWADATRKLRRDGLRDEARRRAKEPQLANEDDECEDQINNQSVMEALVVVHTFHTDKTSEIVERGQTRKYLCT